MTFHPLCIRHTHRPRVSGAILLAALLACTSPAPAALAAHITPLAHRAYTYAPNYPDAISEFNMRAQNSHAQIGVVNAYGGWFTREVVGVDINCSATPAADQRVLSVHNTYPSSVTVLSCSLEDCSTQSVIPAMSTGIVPRSTAASARALVGNEYRKCNSTIPVAVTPALGMTADLFLDPTATYLVFVFNSTFDQECWPSKEGVFSKEITLPMSSSSDCAGATAETERESAAAALQRPQPAARFNAVGEDRLQRVARQTVEAATVGFDGKRYVTVVEPFGHPSSNLTAYSSISGVQSLTVVVDGRMDLCSEYAQFNETSLPCASAPDISTTTDAQIAALAQQLAATYCPLPYVEGLQIDLEPFSGVYVSGVTKLINATATALRSTDHGCVSTQYPTGRSLSFFGFAEDVAGTDMLKALGPNGLMVISGYDLYAKDDTFAFNTPAEYNAKLQKQVAAAKVALGAGTSNPVPFTVGIPVSASTHEYERYVSSRYHCGPACKNYTNPAGQDTYVSAALDVMVADKVFDMSGGDDSQFRGVTFWLFGGPTALVEYPPHSGNRFFPANPTDKSLGVLQKRLPELKYPV